MLVRSVIASVLAAHTVTLHDPRIDEASGIGRGIRSPGVYYLQNDSGDTARFFAVDARTGRTRAVFTVPGAVNHDWEDLAVAPDRHGTPSVWLADIGDNTGARSEVEVYRVDEPRVDMTGYGRTETTNQPDVWRLRYPSGPVDAESLAVAPDGRAYIFTKVADGRSVVYELPARPDAHRVQLMHRIGTIRLSAHGGLVPASLQLLATGASISSDGSLLVVRTYTDAYLWRLHDGDVAAALRSNPFRLILPLQQQGEGVCIVGRRLVLDSEGRDSAIVRVQIPSAVLPLPAASSTSARATPTPTGSPLPTPSASAAPAVRGWSPTSGTALAVAAGIAAAVILVAAAGMAWRRRRE